MSTSTRHRSTLRARRIRQRVLVARSHPNPERLRLQMHGALSAHLPEALDAALAQTGASDEDVVWRIRHLALDVSVNAKWDDRQLARAWAMQLARAVRRAIEKGGDGITVVRFGGRAAYLASFVREVADGTAWTRWWFGSFSGLKLLSRSATLRTALIREPALGLQAFATMSAADASLVVAHLSGVDARTVLDAISPALVVGDANDAVTMVLDAHRRLGRPSVRDNEERWALTLVAESLRRAPERTSRACIEIARAMARLARIAESGAVRMGIVRRLLGEGNSAALHLAIGSDDAHRVAPLARTTRDRVDAIVEEFAATSVEAGERGQQHTDQIAWMPIAAPFLLAPFIAALPLDEITRGWPALGQTADLPMRRATAAALVRLYIMAVACGGERAARVLADPTTRLLAGVGTAVSTAELHAWLHSLRVFHAARLEWTLGDWRIGKRIIDTDTWMLATPSDTSAVLLDSSHGHWLAVRDADLHVRSSLRHWLERSSVGVYSEHALTQLAAKHATERGADPYDRSNVTDAIAATLTRVDHIGAEVEWLKLPASIGAPRAFELALAVAAQGVLRDFARRLPGFSRASLPHLWTNFLAIDAHVEHKPQRVSAVLGKPPLAPVMSMTGMMRATYRLAWCGERAIALFPAEGR
jgi:hypothetical protein